jgi:hypothetical protein
MTGPLLPQGQFYRLKAAFRDLVEKAGGLERAAERTGYGKSSLQRWASAEHPDVMPLTAALLLESDTGSPLVTAAMAGLQGLSLAGQSLQPEPSRSALLEQWAGLGKAFTEMAGGMAFAMADGEVTVTEARAIDEAAAGLSQQIETLRQKLASHNGKPLKVVS